MRKRKYEKFRWEGYLIGVILKKINWVNLAVFSPGPPLFSPQIEKRIGRKNGWIKITHLPLPVLLNKI